MTERNEYSAFDTEEIDVACWNERSPGGLAAQEFPHIILIECKNWSKPLSSMEVAWFITKLWARGRTFGILVAACGITGNSRDLNRSHHLIARALAQGIHILVLTKADIFALKNSDDLVRLLQSKLVRLVLNQTSLQ